MLRRTVLSLTTLAAIAAAALFGAGIAEAAPAPLPVKGASAILDSGINFTEPHGSEGISATNGKCIAVDLATTGSIRHEDGTMTLWTGPNCRTGKWLVTNQSNANLQKLGFGQTKSIWIGDNHPR
jgi:hypothetical protein